MGGRNFCNRASPCRYARYARKILKRALQVQIAAVPIVERSVCLPARLMAAADSPMEPVPMRSTNTSLLMRAVSENPTTLAPPTISKAVFIMILKRDENENCRKNTLVASPHGFLFFASTVLASRRHWETSKKSVSLFLLFLAFLISSLAIRHRERGRANAKRPVVATPTKGKKNHHLFVPERNNSDCIARIAPKHLKQGRPNTHEKRKRNKKRFFFFKIS